MKLPVYLYGHPVLRRQAEELPQDFPGLKDLVKDMFAAMYESEGVGLAAPQIGKSIRLVVIDADPVAEAFPECAGRKFVLVNPEIEILDGEKVSRAEGCLSLPGVSENVPRVEHIHLRWLDEDIAAPRRRNFGFSRTHSAARVRPSRRQSFHRPYFCYPQAAYTPKTQRYRHRSCRCRLSGAFRSCG